jgi:hypothetical protein
MGVPRSSFSVLAWVIEVENTWPKRWATADRKPVELPPASSGVIDQTARVNRRCFPCTGSRPGRIPAVSFSDTVQMSLRRSIPRRTGR